MTSHRNRRHTLEPLRRPQRAQLVRDNLQAVQRPPRIDDEVDELRSAEEIPIPAEATTMPPKPRPAPALAPAPAPTLALSNSSAAAEVDRRGLDFPPAHALRGRG